MRDPAEGKEKRTMSKKMQEEFFEDVSYITYSLLLGAFMYIDNIDDAFLPPEIKSIKRQIETLSKHLILMKQENASNLDSL